MPLTEQELTELRALRARVAELEASAARASKPLTIQKLIQRAKEREAQDGQLTDDEVRAILSHAGTPEDGSC